jgi:type II secretory pathway pseudopilin PulG
VPARPRATPRARSIRVPGFTLVELLVVIGIIVLLIGILLPMIARAYRQSQRARIASDLNAISAALEDYKHDFGDYPRLIYLPPTGSLIYNGTGAGAALLGKALLGLGDGTTATFSTSVAYNAGQIVTETSIFSTPNANEIDFEAAQNVPAGAGSLTVPTSPGTGPWQPIALGMAFDGADGPGFRLRGEPPGGSGTNTLVGHVYGPYLQPDKFKTYGLAIVDIVGNPILYYAANPAKPKITVDATVAANGGGTFGAGNSYVGTAPGIVPGASTQSQSYSPTAPCQSFYNYADNDTVALNTAYSGQGEPFIPAFPYISAMEAMLGDYSCVGYIARGETPATTASFLLWSAGPDGIYGPVGIGTGSASESSFQSLGPAAIKNLVIKCDDVTNFSFAQ